VYFCKLYDCVSSEIGDCYGVLAVRKIESKVALRKRIVLKGLPWGRSVWLADERLSSKD
jgi:hypothetical protein